jgi:hypothetical protein
VGGFYLAWVAVVETQGPLNKPQLHRATRRAGEDNRYICLRPLYKRHKPTTHQRSRYAIHSNGTTSDVHVVIHSIGVGRRGDIGSGVSGYGDGVGCGGCGVGVGLIEDGGADGIVDGASYCYGVGSHEELSTLGIEGRKVRIHWCWLDKECREAGAPNRLHIGGLMIGARSQWWDPWHGYTKFWSPVSFRMKSNRLCQVEHGCSRLRGHRGNHRVLKW